MSIGRCQHFTLGLIATVQTWKIWNWFCMVGNHCTYKSTVCVFFCKIAGFEKCYEVLSHLVSSWGGEVQRGRVGHQMTRVLLAIYGALHQKHYVVLSLL